MTALDRKLLRDLARIKGQVLAIAFVIAAGVGMFVTFLGTLDVLESTRDAYYERYRFAEVFARVKRAPQALGAEIEAIPGVQTVETRIVADVVLDILDMVEPATGRLVSLPERDEPVLNRLVVREGRLPARPFEAVVSEAFAEAHGFRPGDHVDAIVNQRKRALLIVGVALSPEYVFSMPPGTTLPDDRRFGVLWLPRETLAAAFDLEGAFNDVALTLLRGASEPAVIEELDRLLERYGGLGAHGRDEQMSHFLLATEMDQLRAMTAIAPPIFLAIAAFLLNVAVTRLIETEREQIGLLKAFGFGNLAVGWHYAKMVLVITALGIVLGFLLGAWMGRGMTALYEAYYRFPFLLYRPGPAPFAFAALVSVAAALAGTALALRRAVMLPPADAMRPAAPPRYRRGLLERWGLVRWITQPSRIILRHIGRWPLRAALTTLGIAAGVALMVGVRFSIDAFDVMIDAQFFKGNPHDAAIHLVEPRAEGALFDALGLPGVIHAEPFRSVAVRLRVGPRQERIALTGLEPDGELAHRLDQDLQPIALPPEGLLLGSGLAAKLGVGRGDLVVLEVLEGRRPVVEARVAAVAEEFIGNTATMRRTALNRLLQEGPVISGAYLRIDPDRTEELYARLKETPAVGAVMLQREVLRSFYEMWEQNIATITLFNMLFAGMIAFGVIYNSARIALSERGRELASLRVLGMTRGEVTYILLGELALLTVIALPIGCVLGYGLAWLMVIGFESDLYRLPLIIGRQTYGLAALTAIAAAVVSGVVVGRRVRHLDLVAVLKTRE
jgi:putative ABC transport system permease protein